MQLDNQEASGLQTQTEDVHTAILPKLLEVALLAARYGNAAEAKTIALAVEAIRPGHPTPILIRALTSIYTARFREAADILTNEVLKENPEHPQAKAFLALALQKLGNNDAAHRLLNEVIAGAQEPQAVSLAKVLLEG